MSFVLQLAGIFCGIFFRTLLPYLRKVRSKNREPFKGRYLATALSSLLISFFTTFLVISSYSFSRGGVEDAADGIRIFSTAFAFGYAWNSLINEGMKWSSRKSGEHL